MSLAHWAVIALLTAFNALYVAAEFAAVAAKRSALMALIKTGDRRAASFMQVVQDRAALDRYIAACQIGITLSSLVAGAYAQSTIAFDLGPIIEATFALQPDIAHSISAIVVLIGLTAFQVLLAELVPKSLALQFPERIALATFAPMRWSVRVFKLFIWLLNGAGFIILRPFGIRAGGQPHVHSPKELELLFAESRRGGELSPEMHRRLQHSLNLSQRTVRQLMAPRNQLDAIEASTPDAEILRRVLASSFSRLPVYRGTIDQVLGSVSTKDIVAAYVTHGAIPPLVQLLRPIPFVPSSLTADRLVHVLQTERSSKAVVVDEFGGVQGMISVDDLLTDVFGELGEERRSDASTTAEFLVDGRVKLRGSIRAAAAEPWLGESWEGSAATVGGLIADKLGRLPLAGEQIELNGAQITVLEVSPTAVLSVAVRARPRAREEETG
ncbi:MAG TPA: hemolysin family protein [Polyangiales bacterium]|nr:hemolysin family protein [Polyangiales bacterium]